MYFKQLLKSKTINLNAIYAALIALISQGFGVDIPPAVATGGLAILNFILRHVTQEPLMEKDSLL